MSKTFAILNGNVVANIIVAETNEDAELVAPGCIEYNADNVAQIGWLYDSETGIFAMPIEQTPEVAG